MNITLNPSIRLSALACVGLLGIAGPRWSVGQTPSPAPATDATVSHPNAQSEAGEPRAMTSPEAPNAGLERQDGGKPEEGGKSGEGGRPREGGKPDAPGKARGSGKSAAADKLQLQTATVTGDQEQPKVMYIVPWKRSDIGDLSGKPMNSLLDEALAPVDRDEFKREVVYYQAVRADASQNGAAAGAPTTPAPPR